MADPSRHRVVVTGLGCVSSVGATAVDFWRSLCDRRSGAGPITRVPTAEHGVKVAAEVKDFDPATHFDRRQLSLLDPFAQYALVAAREAISDSGLELAEAQCRQTAVVLGTGVGGNTNFDEGARRVYAEGRTDVHPMSVARAMSNAAVSHIAIEYGVTGPAFAVTSACASSNHAVGQAVAMIRHGMVTAAVTGGSEACLTLGTLKAWKAMRVMAPDACRPFSRGRKGMVLGEGAGILVLESLESARSRGATNFAEVAGFGMSSDACDIVHPSVDGTALAIQAALDDASLCPETVDYVNAHGTATKVNDVTETTALHRVFGTHASRIVPSVIRIEYRISGCEAWPRRPYQ